MGQWQISNLNTCTFHNFNKSFEILMDPLENLMSRRILNMHLRAKLMIVLYSLYMGAQGKIKSLLPVSIHDFLNKWFGLIQNLSLNHSQARV